MANLTPGQPGPKWTVSSSVDARVFDENGVMFRTLFERTTDPVWLLDPADGTVRECNPAALNSLGLRSAGELIGRRMDDLSPEPAAGGAPARAEIAAALSRALAEGSHRFEWVCVRPEGGSVPLEVVLTAVPNGGAPVLLAVGRDISQHKREHTEVQHLHEHLEQRVIERTAELLQANEQLKREIQERKRAEALLRESEARARTLVENAPEAIVVFDGLTGRFLECNRNAVELYGLPREDLIGRHPAELSPLVQPDGRISTEAAREKIQQALDGQTPVFEWTHRHSSGRFFPCEVRLVRLHAEGKHLIRGSVIDNTERRRRERVQQATYEISEAVHSVQDLEQLYERIHRIVKTLMPADNFYIAQLEGPNLISFPYHVDEVTLRPAPCPLGTGLTGYVFRFGKPLLVDAAMNARKRYVGDEVTFEGFADIRYTESGVPAAIWLGVPLSFGGRTVGVMAVQDYHDPNAYGEAERQLLGFVAGQVALAIERKTVEQALRESEQKHRALFEASSQGVILHDQEKILEVNSAAVRLLGFERAEDLVGKHPVESSAPIQAGGRSAEELAAGYIRECLSRGTARFDWIARSPTKTTPVEVILTRIPMGGRDIIQAVINDITQRKQAEEELLRTLAREKELGQLRSNFVSMVSHEFRTPLGIIQSSAEILEDYFDRLEAQERNQHLQSIRRNTRRMAGLMEEVLLIGRFEAGKVDFKPERLDLTTFARKILEEVASVTENRCPIELAAAELTGSADERLLRHIFSNLLLNAVKYSEPGQAVKLSLERAGDDLVCRFKDRGIGIPAEDLEWIFQAFHRGRNVGDRPGTGLGMVIVKRCVDLHGGSIVIKSAPGDGTEITVRLPVFAAA